MSGDFGGNGDWGFDGFFNTGSQPQKYDGVKKAYDLDWGDGFVTSMSGGGDQKRGDFAYHESDNIDLVISAVPAGGDVNVGCGDMSCVAAAGAVVKAKRIVYLKWPDYGVPKYTKAFWLALVSDIYNRRMTTVHCQCAGGHGRTGTMLAILFQLSTNRFNNVGDLIRYIREQYRPKAVETREQAYYIASICDISVDGVDKLFIEKPIVVATKTQSTTKGKGVDTPMPSMSTKNMTPEQVATSKTPEFLSFDRYTNYLDLDVAVVIYERWLRCGKPEVRNAGPTVEFYGVPVDQIKDDKLDEFKKQSQPCWVNQSHIK